MEGVGAFLGLFAVYLGWCSVSSFRPLALGAAIIAAPGDAGKTVAAARAVAAATAASAVTTTADVSGSADSAPNTSSTNLGSVAVGTNTTGSSTLPAGYPTAANRASYQAYANDYGKSLFGGNWSPAAMADLVLLWNKESGWNPKADNSSSGAYGIAQELGHNVAANYRTDPQAQIQWGLQYIKSRYGSVQAAWAHETAFNWY